MEPRHADVLLVGGGVAAARCARTLRRGGFAGSIVLVGDEPLPPYNRPPLSKELLRGEVSEELILAEPESWYERRRVELLLGVPAAALDADARSVELADGTRLAYGSCLLASGLGPRRASIPSRSNIVSWPRRIWINPTFWSLLAAIVIPVRPVPNTCERDSCVSSNVSDWI